MRIQKMSRPTRPSDWLLWSVATLHNMFYVATTALDGAVALIDNSIKHRDDTDEALEQFHLDLETLDSKED